MNYSGTSLLFLIEQKIEKNYLKIIILQIILL